MHRNFCRIIPNIIQNVSVSTCAGEQLVINNIFNNDFVGDSQYILKIIHPLKFICLKEILYGYLPPKNINEEFVSNVDCTICFVVVNSV